MLAAVTIAVSPSAIRRRRGCSSSIWLGVTTIMPTNNTPSKAGTSHEGPTVKRSGKDTCKRIAATIVSWAGQNGSLSGGGG